MIDVQSLGADATKDNKADKYKAINLLAVQLKGKNYAQGFGIDTDFFINSEYEINPRTFTTHIIKRMADYAISITDVTSIVDDFVHNIKINIKDK